MIFHILSVDDIFIRLQQLCVQDTVVKYHCHIPLYYLEHFHIGVVFW